MLRFALMLGAVALICAVLGLGAAAMDGAGMYVAMGLGLFASSGGWIAYRRSTQARDRLLGAAGITLGLAALFLGSARIGLTLAVISRLSRLLD